MSYLNSYYNPSSKPHTGYPEKLVKYLVSEFSLQNKSLLEAGVGRCEHLDLFHKLGLSTSGFDSDPIALKYNSSIKIFDCESDIWPYNDNSFDILYSKSFIEHLTDPSCYFKQAYRILKPGGIILSLTPDWEVNYKKFYDDFTHKSPFTYVSLQNIMHYSGFLDTSVFKLRQLPITWRYPILNPVLDLLIPFIPVRTTSKYLRWSRELMLIGIGYKPLSA